MLIKFGLYDVTEAQHSIQGVLQIENKAFHI
jgi:hypothetical protein